MQTNSEYKNLCRSKKQQYYENFMESFENYDPFSKQWWRFLKDLKNEKLRKSRNIHISDFLEYFKSLLISNSSDEWEGTALDVENDVECLILDKAIELNELDEVLMSLPLNKAPGPDRVSYEFYKYAPPNFKSLLLNFFNAIWSTETIPQNFKDTLIFPIFKKGDIGIVQNYRGISFLNTIAKIFTAILLRRLEHWAEHFEILNEYQAGFRKNYTTFDNIYNLISITKILGSKTYCFFVDFKSAFDTINRNALFHKLQKIGLSKKVLKILREWYTNTVSTIWDGENLSEQFVTKVGLRQGCMLSPFLFSIFINDLHETIKGGVNIRGLNIRVLKYADDLVVIADKPDILQSMIRRLYEYCNNWNLIVNLEKSKIVIFNKSGTTGKNERWFFGKSRLEIVTEYKYLGVILTSKLSMKRQFEEKLKLAKYSLSIIWNRIIKNRNIKLSLKLKIFEIMWRSVICYGAQVWGHSKYDEVESLLRYFLKFLFYLPQSTPSYMIKIELNSTSIFSYCFKLHTNYILRVLSLHEKRLPRHLTDYIISKKIFWMENWQNITEICQLPLPDLNSPVPQEFRNWSKQVLEIIETKSFEEARSLAKNGLHHNLYPKLDHCRIVKYVNDDFNVKAISNIFKSRCDLLPLNAAIYLNKTNQNCSLCNMNESENTEHFIAKCPCFSETRQQLFGKRALSEEELIEILNGSNFQHLQIFVDICMKFRVSLINEFNYS